MTDEIRIKANQLAKQIEDTQKQIEMITDMQEHNSITLYNSEIGSVDITDTETKACILDIVESMLTSQKERLEDEYRIL